MDLTRREFFGSVSAVAAAGTIRPEKLIASIDDPLGVRADFPVVGESISTLR